MAISEDKSAQPDLLELQVDCLVALLQRCAANDQRSFFSAARSHSKLRDAAAQVLRMYTHSVTVALAPQQAESQLDSVLLFLSNHSENIDSISLKNPCRTSGSSLCSVVLAPTLMLTLRELPPSPQMHSLVLVGFDLQLQPSSSFPGVLTASRAAALTQLQLESCSLLDDDADAALAAAVSQLPASLQRLSIKLYPSHGQRVHFGTGELQRLQQLTSLVLEGVVFQGPGDSPALQPLQGLTRLADLQLRVTRERSSITASMLSGMHNLTRLMVSGDLVRGAAGFEEVSPAVEAGALAGKTRMLHLDLGGCCLPGGAAGVAQLLTNLQGMQHLTHLNLRSSPRGASVLLDMQEGDPPATALAALTASSKLQSLSISHCTLPAGTWQHLFPAGRQLPFLQSLNISRVSQLGGSDATAPEASRLVSCCPSLQDLNMDELQCSAEPLTPLQGLSGLHTLHLLVSGPTAAEGLAAVCQLTGLKALSMCIQDVAEGLALLQLTQLRQLTELAVLRAADGDKLYRSHGSLPMVSALLAVALCLLFAVTMGRYEQTGWHQSGPVSSSPTYHVKGACCNTQPESLMLLGNVNCEVGVYFCEL